MSAPNSKKRKSVEGLKSSTLMSISSSDEDEIQQNTKDTDGNKSESEDGEIDELTELDVLRAKGNAEVDAMIEKGLASGGRDVMQKDARYFMIENVVCEHCGIKGHLSYDCKEERAAARCFMCGKSGHSSRDCPEEVCFYCKNTGHRFRDCPQRSGGGNGRKRRTRTVLPSRPTKMTCYVCGGDNHLDCAILKPSGAVLSCHNCGMTGHAGGGCHMTNADRVIPIVLDMERERRQSKAAARDNSKKSAKGGGEADRKADNKGKKDANADGKTGKITPKEYREAFLERARKSRYGKRDR